jgi:hypothetical protein
MAEEKEHMRVLRTIEFSTVRLHYSSAVNPLALSRQGSPPARDSQRVEQATTTRRHTPTRGAAHVAGMSQMEPAIAPGVRICPGGCAGRGEKATRCVWWRGARENGTPTPLPHTGPGNYCMTAADPAVSYCRHPGNPAPVRRSNIVFRIQLAYGLQCPFPFPNPPPPQKPLCP